jgi:polyribonucleotide nucleotidyltransferase
MGNCAILATVVANKEPKPGQSFFPLSVDYQEKFAAAGRIPGSFFKREGRLSDNEILISRLIDRALRPLFPDDYLCDVQVLVTLISSDPKLCPTPWRVWLLQQHLPYQMFPSAKSFQKCVSLVLGQFVINPTRAQMKESTLDFIIAATEKNIMMVEGESKECSEEDLIQAIEAGHNAIKMQVQAQRELWEMVGSPAKRDYTKPYRNEELNEKVTEFAKDKIYQVAKSAMAKHDRSDALKAIGVELVEHLGELPEDAALVGYYLHKLEKEVIRNMMVDEKTRLMVEHSIRYDLLKWN